MNWQKLSGYCDRALVKADLGRYKRTIREALPSQKDARQNTEVAVAVGALNRTPEVGRPEYVRIAQPHHSGGGFHAFALRSTNTIVRINNHRMLARVNALPRHHAFAAALSRAARSICPRCAAACSS